jgi:hypothetical protein
MGDMQFAHGGCAPSRTMGGEGAAPPINIC